MDRFDDRVRRRRQEAVGEPRDRDQDDEGRSKQRAYAYFTLPHQKVLGREAERRYRELFENIQEGLFFSTPEGRFVEVNDAHVSCVPDSRTSSQRKPLPGWDRRLSLSSI